ncbi:Protein of unknown function [Pyronema omphalodes CBS 100304]|uniref:Uncharacterized protein n=1 Tax=Pyronema omphalodes (strain CBS 100304) TaxID=1076935 RepID=U4L3Q0_PYROM|nr:Protein of unknown function [Pyronema omphalodes CBS 100304]
MNSCSLLSRAIYFRQNGLFREYSTNFLMNVMGTANDFRYVPQPGFRLKCIHAMLFEHTEKSLISWRKVNSLYVDAVGMLDRGFVLGSTVL